MQSHYETRDAGWAGGGFSFDDFGTSIIETVNLGNLDYLTFGLKGDASAVKVEVVDINGKKAVVTLSLVQSSVEQVWAIPRSLIPGIDWTQVRLIYFIIEGKNLFGTLEVNHTSLVQPSVSLSPSDILSLPGEPQNVLISPEPGTSFIFPSAGNRGVILRYSTGRQSFFPFVFRTSSFIIAPA